MAFGPPSDGPGPFGAPPAGPFGPQGPGFAPVVGLAPIVVRRVRLLPRLVGVLVFLAVSLAITAAVGWFGIVAGTGLGGVDGDGPARVIERSTEGEIVPRVVEVPEAWPDALAPPAGATVTTSVVTAGGTPDEQLLLVYEVGQGTSDTADGLRTQLGAAGMRITGDATTADGTGSLTATGAGHEATVVVRPTPARPDVTTVSWVLRPGLR